MYQAESNEDFKSLQKRKWVLLVIDIVVFLVAVALIPVCFWIRFDLDFWEWVVEMDWYVYWYCMYVVLVALVLVVLTSILQAYAVIVEAPFALVMSVLLFIICWFLELVGGTLIVVYGVEESDVLTNSLDKVFFRLIYQMDNDDRTRRILKIVQEYVRCCGSNGSEDYIGAHKPVPFECRHPVTGNEYTAGCKQTFAWYLEPWTGTLAGACVFLLIAHIVQIVLNFKLSKELRKYEKANAYETYDD